MGTRTIFQGTRADFYVGRGERAEWIGSIAYDGDHPVSVPVDAKTEAEFREFVATTLAKRDDYTSPEMGWPWPWKDSAKTNLAWSFDGGVLYASDFGRPWMTLAEAGDPNFDPDAPGRPKPEHPDMSARRALAEPGTPRSGVRVVEAS